MSYVVPIQIFILLVRLTLDMPDATHVSVAGSWDGWDQHNLTQTMDGSGKWYIDLELDSGIYEYRFIVDDTLWIKDPSNPNFGGTHSNSLLHVGFENSPEIELVHPRPGSKITKFPVRLSVRYESGADNAPANPDRSYIRIGQHHEDLRISSQDPSILEAVFTSLPEGEVKVHAVGASKTGYMDSLVALLLVNNRNQRPVARTDHVIISELGAPVTLDGALSYDPDGELLTAYRWEIIHPDSGAHLQNTDSPYPRLVPRSDLTVLTLTVYDGNEWSVPDTAHVFTHPQFSQPLEFSCNPRELGLDTLEISSITVTGTWNGWRTDRDSLTRTEDGSWVTYLWPGPGIHEYQYCINGHLRTTDPSKRTRGSNNILSSTAQWRTLPDLRLKRDDSGTMIGYIEEPRNVKAVLFSDSGLEFRLSSDDRLTFPLPAIGRNRLHTHIVQVEPTDAYRPVHILDFRDEFGIRHARNLDRVPDWSEDAIIGWMPRKSFSELAIDLSHMVSLGVNTVWLPPVLPSPMEHGYAPVDHFTIDPALGTPDELRTFIQHAHGLGLRVILDFIANHTSDQTIRFGSSRNPEGQWHSWYRWHEDGTPHHWFHWDQLVNLNLENATVRRHLLASASFLRGFGIDGFRLDVAWALPQNFLKQLRTESRFRSADFLLLGEVIPREPRFHTSMLDMSYDTDFYGLILDLLNGELTPGHVPLCWSEISSRYPPESVGMTYIENHDTGRLQDIFTREQCDLAGLLLFTWPGAPLILTARDEEIGSLSTDLLRRLVQVRKLYPALRTRSMKWFEIEADLLAYHRPGSIPCIVIANPSDRAQNGTINDLPAPTGRSLLWVPVLSVGHPPDLNQRGSTLNIQCHPWSGTILIPEPFVLFPTGEA